MDTVLVTGGAGYAGSLLVRRLLSEGYRVVAADALAFGGESLLDLWRHPQFAFHKCDITDFSAVDALLRTYDLHAIVHLAAIVGDPACKRDPDLAHRTNWDASVHLLESCLDRRIPRFVFASTCSNYGKMADSAPYVTEDSPLAPVSLYAELKVKVETLILNELPRSAGFCPTSLRFATIYGLSPRMRFDLTVNEFTKDLALGKELLVFGEQFWRPYCHVEDFGRAVVAVLQAEASKVAYNVFNVGDTGENYTKKMVLEEILRLIPHGRVKYVQQAEDPRDYRVDFSKIANVLGFRISRRVPDGIAEVKQIVESGVIRDPEDQRYYNTPHRA
jgi:nucleoside-diphosphate-sugar epimerase